MALGMLWPRRLSELSIVYLRGIWFNGSELRDLRGEIR